MILQVLDWALTGDDGLNEESEHGNHGKTAVLDLLDLQLCEGVGVISQAQGVEGLTGVVLVQTLTSRSTVDTVSLHESHQHDLGDQSCDNGLGMDQRGVAEVVQATVGEDLGPSLEPNGLSDRSSVVSQQLGHDASEGSKHGPASMHQLSLTVGCEGVWVCGETCSVPSVVTGVLSLQVRGDGTIGVGSQPLGAVWSVELNGGLGDGLSLGLSCRVCESKPRGSVACTSEVAWCTMARQHVSDGR